MQQNDNLLYYPNNNTILKSLLIILQGKFFDLLGGFFTYETANTTDTIGLFINHWLFIASVAAIGMQPVWWEHGNADAHISACTDADDLSGRRIFYQLSTELERERQRQSRYLQRSRSSNDVYRRGTSQSQRHHLVRLCG